jgi:predicted nucleic acid-binding protein
VAKLHVFIDTNVFLNFYAYTNDDIEELSKLVALIKSDQLKLYLTRQVSREFYKNRETKIVQAIADFSALKIPGLPRLLGHYTHASEFQDASKKLKKSQNALIEAAKADALAQDLPADKLFAQIAEASSPIDEDEAVLQRARLRNELNQPPGKSGSLGDRLNWELLLAHVP